MSWMFVLGLFPLHTENPNNNIETEMVLWIFIYHYQPESDRNDNPEQKKTITTR